MANTTESTKQPSVPESPARPRKRWKRWCVALAVLISLWWVATQSPLVRWVISGRLAQATGLRLSEGSVTIGLSGHIAVTDAVIRSPDIDGPGGEILRVDRLDAAVSWRRLLGMQRDNGPGILQVMLYRPRLRLSQSTVDGTLNASAFRLGPSSGGGPAQIPLVQIDEGVIELGEHAGVGARDAFTKLKHIDLHGRITPSSAGEDGSVRFELTPDAPRQGDATAPAAPVTITGTVQGSDLSLEVGGLSLRDWPPSAMPSRIRTLAEMLALEGKIGRTTFGYSPSTSGGRPGIRAAAELIDVSVNLPITEDAQVTDSSSAPLLRMSHVNGLLEVSDQGATATLVGSIEEVPYSVDLRYHGASPNSAFECKVLTENFRMEKGLRILRFVPPLVRERLADFSWPTGLVNSSVTISRAAPVDGKPAELSVTGEMQVSEAVSAFKRFPYEFRNLSGRVTFSDTRIDLLDIKGKSTAGAVIHASGFIEPPTADAHCVIDVHVDGLRVDEDVIRALTARRKAIPPVIFNHEHYKRMLAAGLLAAPGDTTAPPSVPRFGLDGMAKVHTVVTRPAGPDTEWLENTDIDFDYVSILPEWFPLPMIATGVQVRIGDDRMTVKEGEYKPIVGGRATAVADVDYNLVIDPTRDGSPEVTVTAADVPAGRLLNYAIGAAIDRANRNKPGGSAGPRLRGILDDLSATGLVSGNLKLYNDKEDSGHVSARVDVGPALLTPSYADGGQGAAQLELAAVKGVVTIQDREVLFDLSGKPRVRSAGAIPAVESAPQETAGSVRVTGRSGPDSKGESAFTCQADLKGIELSYPLDQVVGVFSPSAAARWKSLTAQYSPSGRVSGRVVVEPDADGSAATVTVDGFESLAMGTGGKQTELASVDGSVVVLPDGSVAFHSFVASLRSGEEDQGMIRVGGTLHSPQGDGPAVPSSDFKAALEHARAEAPILRALALQRLSKESGELLTSLNPRGEFDAAFEVKEGAGQAGAPGVVGTIKPRSMTVTMHDTEVPFTTMEGEINFDGDGGQLRGVEGKGAEFAVRVDGSWSKTPEGDSEIGVTITGKSQGLPAPLRALLPDSVRGVFTSIELDVAGAVDLSVMQLQITESSSPDRQKLLAGGKVRMTGGRMTLGLDVTECDGSLDFRVSNNNFATPAGFGIDARLDNFRLGGLAMQRGVVGVEGKPETGEIVVPTITADCYGGKVAGKALIGRPGPNPREFQAEFSLSGVRFAPTLRDLTASAEKPIDEQPPSDDDASRGLVDGQLTIGGRIDDPASRRGRGSANIAGPSVLRMPLVMPLIRFSNFQLPTDEPLDLAHASFYIDGPVMAFEEVSVFSESVHIMGFGTMTWPGLALDLRFNSKAIKRIPVLNWLLEGIRDEIVTTQVTGTMGKPDVASVPFDSTRKFFLQIFGSGISEQDRRMLELGKEAEKGTR